jgi:Ca2+-binding EF-hand superfamily protein
MQSLQDIKPHQSNKKTDEIYRQTRKQKFAKIFSLLDSDCDGLISMNAISINTLP